MKFIEKAGVHFRCCNFFKPPGDNDQQARKRLIFMEKVYSARGAIVSLASTTGNKNQ